MGGEEEREMEREREREGGRESPAKQCSLSLGDACCKQVYSNLRQEACVAASAEIVPGAKMATRGCGWAADAGVRGTTKYWPRAEARATDKNRHHTTDNRQPIAKK